MRGLKLTAVAALAVVVVGITGCGVAAPRHVAEIDGIGVSMEQVDEIAREPLFQLTDGKGDKSDLSGETARQALLLKLSQVVWISEAKRWGLDIAPARQDAEAQLDTQLASIDNSAKLSKSIRSTLIDAGAAQSVLQDRFSKLDPTSDSDLKEVYRLGTSLWDRTCAFIMLVPEGSAKRARSMANMGADFNKIAEGIEGASVVAQPDQGCLSKSSIPFEMRTDIANMALETADVIELTTAGQTENYLVKVMSRQVLSFEEAKDDAAQIVASLQQGRVTQQWVAMRLSEAWIDPRFGLAVNLDSQGQPTIIPPVGPIQNLDAVDVSDLSDLVTQ